MKCVKLFIDSMDRNTTEYPNSNRFRVTLAKPIPNVKRIGLGSAVIPNIAAADPFPYVAVVTDLFLRGVTFATEMPSYPAGTVGILFNNRPAEKFIRYQDEGDEATWYADAPGGIARLQEFEISLQTFNSTTTPPQLYPLVVYAPGKYPEWNCVLKIHHRTDFS